MNWVSIHAPRAGGDDAIGKHLGMFVDVSIHAPRAGGDAEFLEDNRADIVFQSTPPARGATLMPLPSSA